MEISQACSLFVSLRDVITSDRRCGETVSWETGNRKDMTETALIQPRRDATGRRVDYSRVIISRLQTKPSNYKHFLYLYLTY